MTTSSDLSVASYNIHKGDGTDRRRDLARTTAVPTRAVAFCYLKSLSTLSQRFASPP